MAGLIFLCQVRTTPPWATYLFAYLQYTEWYKNIYYCNLDKERLVTDSGKLMILDGLLKNLKKVNGRRVVIYSLLPKMMDLLEVRIELHDYARLLIYLI